MTLQGYVLINLSAIEIGKILPRALRDIKISQTSCQTEMKTKPVTVWACKKAIFSTWDEVIHTSFLKSGVNPLNSDVGLPNRYCLLLLLLLETIFGWGYRLYDKNSVWGSTAPSHSPACVCRPRFAENKGRKEGNIRAGQVPLGKGIIIPTRLKFNSVNFEYKSSAYEKKDSICLKWNRPSSRKYARWVLYHHFQETQLGQKRGYEP